MPRDAPIRGQGEVTYPPPPDSPGFPNKSPRCVARCDTPVRQDIDQVGRVGRLPHPSVSPSKWRARRVSPTYQDCARTWLPRPRTEPLSNFAGVDNFPEGSHLKGRWFALPGAKPCPGALVVPKRNPRRCPAVRQQGQPRLAIRVIRGKRTALREDAEDPGVE